MVGYEEGGIRMREGVKSAKDGIKSAKDWGYVCESDDNVSKGWGGKRVLKGYTV